MEIDQVTGTEVPVIGSEIANWIELALPSRSSPSQGASSYPVVVTPSTDATSGVAFGDPQILVICRVHRSKPNALEISEVRVSAPFPRTGLRVLFPSTVSPFVFICRPEQGIENSYVIHVLCVDGIAYLLKLKRPSSYMGCLVFPSDHFVELDLRPYVNNELITAAAAVNEYLTIGRNDGLVFSFHMGKPLQNNSEFAHEYRDDSGVSRLLGFITGSRDMGSAQDMIVLEFRDQRLLLVLHFNGTLRIWELGSRTKPSTHFLQKSYPEGSVFVKIWVGEVDYNSRRIPFAVLCRGSLQADEEGVFTGSFYFNSTGKISLQSEHSMQIVPLGKRKLTDIKFVRDKLCILTDSCLLLNASVHANRKYELNEAFIADELFHSTENSSDDLPWILQSLCSKTDERIEPFMSSIFLRKILQPGVYHSSVLLQTFLDYSKNWTESDFQLLTADELRNEILLVIQQDGFSRSATSVYYYWKKFCARYFFNWCKHNPAHGFFAVDSTDTVVLLRKNSVSLFRTLTTVELLNHGPPVRPTTAGAAASDLLSELSLCARSMSEKLDRAGSSIYYESVVRRALPHASNPAKNGTIPCLLELLRNGYRRSVTSLQAPDLGFDSARKKCVSNHDSCRKFCVTIFTSLLSLQSRSGVLEIVRAYMPHLVPSSLSTIREELISSAVPLTVQALISVQAIAHTSKKMFDASFDVLFLLHYLSEIPSQVGLSHAENNRLKLELLPTAEDIALKWLVVHLLATSPTVSSSPTDDFTSKLSTLRLGGTVATAEETQFCDWKRRLGRPEFSPALVLLLDDPLAPLTRYPPPGEITNSVSRFAGRIFGIGVERRPFIAQACEIAAVLLRNEQAETAGLFLELANERSSDITWSCIVQHLLGCCRVSRRDTRGAIVFFFRASSVSSESFADLQRLSCESGFPVDLTNNGYLQSVMEIFEQRGLSDGAFEFTLVALEDADDASPEKEGMAPRLWSNAFKFGLDAGRVGDAYCALVSNPDEESRSICLRRFVIVLCERNLVGRLCDGEIPFVGLEDHVVRELSWMAECSRPDLYRAMYAFDVRRNNYRRAADHMYGYSRRLDRKSGRADALSAAINALEHVERCQAWVRHAGATVGIDRLRDEFAVLSAQDLLDRDDTVDLPGELIRKKHHDAAFSVVLRLFHGSTLAAEMRRAFASMASSDGDREALEPYLEKYGAMDPALPAAVAEAILCSGNDAELPVWLIDLFRTRSTDMATLLRLYVDYGRNVDAVRLLVEFFDSDASSRAKNVMKRKRPFSTWSPYALIDRLWIRLEETSASDPLVADSLKKQLHRSLLCHLNLLTKDSEDAIHLSKDVM